MWPAARSAGGLAEPQPPPVPGMRCSHGCSSLLGPGPASLGWGMATCGLSSSNPIVASSPAVPSPVSRTVHRASTGGSPQWDGMGLLPVRHPPAIPLAAQAGRDQASPPKSGVQPQHEVLHRGKLSLGLRGQGDLAAQRDRDMLPDGHMPPSPRHPKSTTTYHRTPPYPGTARGCSGQPQGSDHGRKGEHRGGGQAAHGSPLPA